MTRPSAYEVRSYLRYEPETGRFFWLQDRGRMRAGNEAGSIGAKGRHIIGLCGRRYISAVLAWVIMTGEWPPLQVDHIDRNRLNDRWLNLRLATQQQNNANCSLARRNRAGRKGIRQMPSGRWTAQTTFNYQQIHLGTFDTAEEAHAAYAAKARQLFGEFAAPDAGRGEAA